MEGSYKHQHEIEAVVDGFETCTTGKEDFRHRDHLTVAVWYLRGSTPDEALARMRTGLHRFLDHHGVDSQKYKEGLTIAWINAVHTLILELDPALSVVEITNFVHERLGDKRVVFDHNGAANLSAE